MARTTTIGISIIAAITCFIANGTATAHTPFPVASSAPASSSYSAYGGGPVIPHVSVVVVFWGPSVNSTVTSSIGSFYQTITDSDYMDWLDEYYQGFPLTSYDTIGRGSLWGQITITPHHVGQSLTDAIVESELGTQIGAGVLPIPTSNTLYMIYFPPGISISTAFGTSCQGGGWCGIHLSNTRTINGVQRTITFGMIPDFGPTSACGNQACGPFQSMLLNVTGTSSHEMAEAITDPAPFSGWSPEIGDPCVGSYVGFRNSSNTEFQAQLLWSNAQDACITGFALSGSGFPKCQQESQAFGISGLSGSGGWGFAPAEVQQWWRGDSCSTSPVLNFSPSTLCQNSSDIYGIQPGNNGYAPSSVITWFANNGCQTVPLVTESNCQRAADAYGIFPFVTFGSAPLYVQQWWGQNSCNVAANGLGACQKAANLYGIVPSQTFGFAPPDIQSDWGLNSCNATTTATAGQLCQNAANMYGIVPNIGWGDAPPNVQTWWTQTGCNRTPQCQGISDLLGTTAFVSWGLASAAVQNWWSAVGCNTAPQFGIRDVCQTIADNFGASNSLANGVKYGFLPNTSTWPAQGFWQTNCSANWAQGQNLYHARSDALRQYTKQF